MQATSFIRWVPIFSVLSVLGIGMPGAIATSPAPIHPIGHEATLVGEPSQPPTMANAAMPVRMVQATGDIVDTAIAQGSFRTFIQLLSQLGMEEDLRGFGRFTVFAPTDEAFDAIPPEVMAVLAGDRSLLGRVLAHHVISSGRPYTSDNVTSSITVRTLQGAEVEIRPRGNSLFIEGNRVVIPDIEATNGVIHGIDTLLIPEDLALEIQQQL